MALVRSLVVELQPLRSSLVFVRRLNRFPFPFPFEENKDQYVLSQREHALENSYFWNKDREWLSKNKEGGAVAAMPPIVLVPGPDTLSLAGFEEANALIA